VSTEGLAADIAALGLVDHHVHGALLAEVSRSDFEMAITESDRPIPAGTTQFDSQVGFAIRRWCAPVLDLEPHASPEDYLARRSRLGTQETTRRLLAASGIEHFLLETGHAADAVMSPEGMRQASGRRVDEVVRLEAVLEEVVRSGCDAQRLPARFRAALEQRTAAAVGLKSIVAYRYGFDFDPARPPDRDVVGAASAWLREVERTGEVRVGDPTLLRFVLWSGVDRGLPLQLHTGYGDPDVELHRCDPLLLTRFAKLVEPTGTALVLLHCYPYHRNAGYLAQAFPHVYFDVGLGTHYTGVRSDAVVAESLELAPFSKILFSSDAWGPPELHLLGALLWRRGMTRALAAWVAAGEWDRSEALRVARMIGRDNARRLYGLAAT
jgi:predicted TIM-barrel fold metal-dependent hydrolase